NWMARRKTIVEGAFDLATKWLALEFSKNSPRCFVCLINNALFIDRDPWRDKLPLPVLLNQRYRVTEELLRQGGKSPWIAEMLIKAQRSRDSAFFVRQWLIANVRH